MQTQTFNILHHFFLGKTYNLINTFSPTLRIIATQAHTLHESIKCGYEGWVKIG
jgi:hypothetical protein